MTVQLPEGQMIKDQTPQIHSRILFGFVDDLEAGGRLLQAPMVSASPVQHIGPFSLYNLSAEGHDVEPTTIITLNIKPTDINSWLPLLLLWFQDREYISILAAVPFLAEHEKVYHYPADTPTNHAATIPLPAITLVHCPLLSMINTACVVSKIKLNYLLFPAKRVKSLNSPYVREAMEALDNALPSGIRFNVAGALTLPTVTSESEQTLLDDSAVSVPLYY